MDSNNIILGIEAATSVPIFENVPNIIFWQENDLNDNDTKYFYSLNHNGGHVFKDNGPFDLISKFHFDNIKSGRAKLIINYPFEGDLGENTWYEKRDDLGWLENWIRVNGIDGKNVYLIHGNLRIKEVIKEQNLSFQGIPYVYFDWLNHHGIPSVQTYHPADDQHLFLSYARRPHIHRVYFTNQLLKNNILHRGKVSLSKFPHPKDDEKELLEMCPLILDNPDGDNIVGIPQSSINHHRETFISTVLETTTNPGTLFLSEKIFKPIILSHPFMVLGSKGTLKALKELGYQTFDKWIDESYDEMPLWKDRANHIVSELVRFSKLSWEELIELREEMHSVITYNHEHYISSMDKKYRNGFSTPFVDALLEIQKTF